MLKIYNSENSLKVKLQIKYIFVRPHSSRSNKIVRYPFFTRKLEVFLTAKKEENLGSSSSQESLVMSEAMYGAVFALPLANLAAFLSVFLEARKVFKLSRCPFKVKVYPMDISSQKLVIEAFELYFWINGNEGLTLEKLESNLKLCSASINTNFIAVLEVVDYCQNMRALDPSGQNLRLFNCLAFEFDRQGLKESNIAAWFTLLRSKETCLLVSDETEILDTSFFDDCFQYQYKKGYYYFERPYSSLGTQETRAAYHYYAMQIFASCFFYHEIFVNEMEEYTQNLQLKEELDGLLQNGGQLDYTASVEKMVTQGRSEGETTLTALRRKGLYEAYIKKELAISELPMQSEMAVLESKHFYITFPMFIAFIISLEEALRNFKVAGLPFRFNVQEAGKPSGLASSFIFDPGQGVSGLTGFIEAVFGIWEVLDEKMHAPYLYIEVRTIPQKWHQRLMQVNKELLEFVNLIALDFGKLDIRYGLPWVEDEAGSPLGKEDLESKGDSLAMKEVIFDSFEEPHVKLQSRQENLLYTLRVLFQQSYKQYNKLPKVESFLSKTNSNFFRLPRAGFVIFIYQLSDLFKMLGVEEVPFFFQVKNSRYIGRNGRGERWFQDYNIYFCKNTRTFANGETSAEAIIWASLVQQRPYLEVELVLFSEVLCEDHTGYYSTTIIVNGEELDKEDFLPLLKVELNKLIWLCGEPSLTPVAAVLGVATRRVWFNRKKQQDSSCKFRFESFYS